MRAPFQPSLGFWSLICAVTLGCASATPKPTRPAPVTPAGDAGRESPDAFRASRPPPTAPGHFEFPTPHVVRLENGLDVYWVPRKTRVLTLAFVVRHGASSVPEGKSGLAALTARMLTEGTRRKSSALLAEAVESLGTSLSAGASRDDSSLELTVLKEDAPAALGLLAEVVMEPAFSQREFERVRNEWLDGLQSERQNPQRLAMLAAVRALHGSVGGAPINGKPSDVEKLSVADLTDFHRRVYTPDNSALIIVGDVDETEFGKEVARQFSAWNRKSSITPPTVPPPAQPEKTRVILVDRPAAVQSALVAVQGFPKRSEPGFEARQLLGRVLGGLFTSRLNTNLRERNAYTYGASAAPIAARNSGTLLVATSVRTDVTPAALSEIVSELERMRDPALGAPLDDAELGRARADLIFSLGATLEHPSRVADTLGSQFVDALPPDYHTRYPELIKGITPDAVNRAAQLIAPQQLLVVIVGDKSKIEPELVKRGFNVELATSALLD